MTLPEVGLPVMNLALIALVVAMLAHASTIFFIWITGWRPYRRM